MVNPYLHVDCFDISIRVDDGADWATVFGPDGKLIDQGHVADVYERIVEHYFGVDRSQPVERVEPSTTAPTRCRWAYDTGAAFPLRCDQAAGHAGQWHSSDGMSWLGSNTNAVQVDGP